MTVDEVVEVMALVRPAIAGMVRANNIVMQCPFAAVSGHARQVDHTPSLGIKPDEHANGGTWNCFSCGRRGDIAWFFHSLEREAGYDCSAALARLEAILYLAPDQIASRIPPYESHFLPAAAPYRVFPESWLAPYLGRVPQKLLDRGITLDTCRAWQIGFDRQQQRIVYPVRDPAGQLVGAVGGAVKLQHEHDVKYRNYWPRVHTCGYPLESHNNRYRCQNCGGVTVNAEHALPGFRKSQHVFGAHLFQKLKRPGEGEEMMAASVFAPVAVVVEGVVDALKVWQATRDFKDAMGFPVLPLALLGSAPSRDQLDLLVNLTGDRRFISFLDNDPAGWKGDRALYELVANRLRFHRARYPVRGSDSGNPSVGLDPGALEESEIRTALVEAQVVMRRLDKRE